MRADDFVRTASETKKASSDLVSTQLTDAINAGIVSGGGDDYGDDIGGRANAVVRTAAQNKAKTAAGQAYRNVVDRRLEAMGVTSHGATSTTSGASEAGEGAVESVTSGTAQAKRQLKDKIASGAKRVGKAGAKYGKATAKVGAQAAVSATLADSELDGIDNAYYKGKATIRNAKRARRTYREIKALRKAKKKARDKGTGKLAEKKYRRKLTATEQQTRAQSNRFMRRKMSQQVEKKVEKEASRKAATAILGKAGGAAASGGLGAAIGAGAIALLVILALVFGIIMAGALSAGANEEEQKKAAAAGLPAWMTTEIVEAAFQGREEYGYPVGGNLAQLILENGVGGSALGQYHNYGGVKWSGFTYGGLVNGKVNMPTSECDENGVCAATTDDFATFPDDASFMKYRHKYLFQQSRYKNSTALNAIKNNDSIEFIHGLKVGGYFTASWESYKLGVESIFNQFPILKMFDSMASYDDFASMGGMGVITVGGGADYQSAPQWQKNVANAAARTPSPGAGLCATWVSNVYANAGLPRPGADGNSYLLGYSTGYPPSWSQIQAAGGRSDFENIKVGQIVTAQRTPTSLGKIYGHVGIYIGDGKVMDNIGNIRVTTLEKWVNEYRAYGWVAYGWPPAIHAS